MLIKHIKPVFLLLMLCVSAVVNADPFRDGVVAYQQQKYKQALDTWLPLAESGHVLAQTLIGSMYAYGQGVEKNDQQAFKWLSRAAKLGSAQAQYNLAILYENGFGTTQSSQQALKWFKAAADQGREDAATRYSALLRKKNIIPEPDNIEISENKTVALNDSKIIKATAEPEPIKQRIHLVLNRGNNKLLGPPDNVDSAPKQHGLNWFRQQPPEYYTIQLAASTEPRLIAAFKNHINLSTNYAAATSTHDGWQWHALIYGSYATVREAKQSIAKFPASWKAWQPWIKKFSSIKHVKQ